jgi:MoxR-like ATPase
VGILAHVQTLEDIEVIQKKIQSIISSLKTEFYERDRIIEAAWLAILSRQHMLQLGVPGTAKSAVTDALCRRVEGTRYFQWLLTRFSTPEELFGPVSLKGLENDEYRRLTTGKLPEANIAFVDEIFKGNAAILNSLLTVINERKFDNGTKRLDVPLVSMFGASNELPEEQELDALYDRFILRFNVPYIQEGKNWEALMQSAVANPVQSNTESITMDDLVHSQKEVAKMPLEQSVIPTMRDIKMSLEREGIVASDRRWKQTVRVLQAKAWLNSRSQVEVQDLEMLCDMLWKEPSQRSVLVSKILSITNPLDLEATKYYDDCLDVFSKFSPDAGSANKEEIAAKLRTALEKIDTTLKIADPNKATRMKEVRASISGWYRQVVATIDV